MGKGAGRLAEGQLGGLQLVEGREGGLLQGGGHLVWGRKAGTSLVSVGGREQLGSRGPVVVLLCEQISVQN